MPAIFPLFDIRTDIRPTVAEVDLAALRKNADLVLGHTGPAVGLLAVVKADAYGHGAAACARALERKVWGFGVSLVEEGIELRRAGIEAPVLVLGSFYGRSHREVLHYRLTPVVSDPADLERFARAAVDYEQERVGIHLKIDTGMARLGVRPEELAAFLGAIRQVPAIEIVGLCTHLAAADLGDATPTLEQLDRFEMARRAVVAAGHRPSLCHAANSAALARFAQARFELVRPGLALYGHQTLPAPEAGIAGLRAAMSLRSRVVALRQVAAGDPVSYGSTHRCARATRIATVPIGYADGYSRRMSGRAEVLIAGKRRRVVGPITMDMCMVDVGQDGEAEVKLGDEVVLLGAQAEERITADELAAWGETIPWEIFCGISKRVPRVYVGDRY